MSPTLLAIVVATSAPDPEEPAAAEPREPESGEASATSPEAATTEPEDPVELAARAEQAFAEGRFEEVAQLAARAYALTGDPRHLYAQALAERRLGDCREALILYARVLARAQDDPAYAALVEGTRQGITLCEESLDAEQAPPEPEPAPEPERAPPADEPPGPEALPRIEPPARPWYRDPVGGSLLAVGLLTAGVGGGVTWALSSRELAAADRSSDETDYADARSRARSQRAGAVVSFAIGGALVTGAVIRYVLVDRKYRRQTAGVVPLPGGAGLIWRGSF